MELKNALALLPMDAITRLGTVGGGSDQTLNSGAGRTVIDFASHTVDLQTDGVIYAPATGDIATTNLVEGMEVAVQFSFSGNPAAAGAQYKLEIYSPDTPEILLWEKDYQFADANARLISELALVWVSADVAANGINVRISNPGTQNLVLEDRHMLVRLA